MNGGSEVPGFLGHGGDVIRDNVGDPKRLRSRLRALHHASGGRHLLIEERIGHVREIAHFPAEEFLIEVPGLVQILGDQLDVSEVGRHGRPPSRWPSLTSWSARSHAVPSVPRSRGRDVDRAAADHL